MYFNYTNGVLTNITMSYLMILKWCQEKYKSRDEGLEDQTARQVPMKEHCQDGQGLRP
jgi:hypothetical protein